MANIFTIRLNVAYGINKAYTETGTQAKPRILYWVATQYFRVELLSTRTTATMCNFLLPGIREVTISGLKNNNCHEYYAVIGWLFVYPKTLES